MFDHPDAITLTTRKLTLAYDGNVIIRGLDLAIPHGQITTLVGPNGCGKSTLLRGMARLLKPQGGTVYLEGEAIAHLPTKALAKRLGILPQSPAAPEGLTVRELVAQGRYPHQNWLQQWSKQDELKVEEAIATTHLYEFANRSLDTLSGGQRQRAWIAMALAQDTQTLLLDEPTTYLDLAHQIEVLDLLYQLNRAGGRTIVMVLHDLNLACRYSHHLVALRDGKLLAQGQPQAIVTTELVRQVFGLESHIIRDPITGTPLCIPISQCLQESIP
ncbi:MULTISPECIES: ABC transporter ATP-binding protein [unclassified Synechocystis]|uniref:ABC transporter ATP-binding protein n=1 Tax=unclassified Synechocystis TaxID=2640012 RepID=UPI0003FA37CE|nr:MULTISPECIES: ABC transporter ATP-binding protein [unclassified Synechocystis]AIE73443.1 Iron(III) dicitrate transport ATP-binding protein FecE [Synechocystis sp. PCC 6714]MCT0254199.1 ABC transporter ATP-binding protein [Synechocystis sp. CS-94]